jgi:hypothetical protein
LAIAVRNKVGYVFYKKYSGTEKVNIGRDGGEDTIVPVAAIVTSVPEATESFARGARNQEIDISDLLLLSGHEVPSLALEEVAPQSNVRAEVMIVDCDSLVPDFVSSSNAEAKTPEPDTNAPHAGAKLHRNTACHGRRAPCTTGNSGRVADTTAIVRCARFWVGGRFRHWRDQLRPMYT